MAAFLLYMGFLLILLFVKLVESYKKTLKY